MMKKGGKKLRLKGEHYSAVITLNDALEVVTKGHEQHEQFWGSFTIDDFDPQVRIVLQSINGLYEYICQNQQEVEIYQGRLVIRLNFLKQSREVELKLNPMLMFSLQEHQKLFNKIKNLEEENSKYKIREQGYRKLTMVCSQQNVNLNHYSIGNLSQVTSYDRLKQLNLLRICSQNTLPENGMWIFDIYPTLFHKEVLSRQQQPWIELGIRGEEGQKNTVKLQGFVPGRSESDFLREGSLIRVFLNIQQKKLEVLKVFQPGQRRIDWANFKDTGRLWLVLVVFGMTVQTDLFVEQRVVDWSANPPKEEKPEE